MRPGSEERIVLLDENDELLDNNEHSLYGPILLHRGRMRRLTHYGASIMWAPHVVDPIPLGMKKMLDRLGEQLS